MKYKFFYVPVQHAEEAEAALNGFLSSRRIVQIQKEFVSEAQNSFWSFCVAYLESGLEGSSGKVLSKIDYKEVLSPEAFARFARLRDWRKATAKEEAIPAYAILTNEQIAAIADLETVHLQKLKEIDGIGEARIKKYGQSIVNFLNPGNQGQHETSTD